jgi:acyl-CoA synthetase (AMP-forming)/AMP-acid ligase II
MTANIHYYPRPFDEFSTLVDLLRYRAQNQIDRRAYTFLQDGETEDASLTYQELDRRARAIAAQLQSIVAPGDRALLLYPSGLEFISAFFGCLYAGVVAVPAYPPKRNQKMSRLQAIVADAQAKVALTTTSELTNIEPRIAENPELLAMQWLASDAIASDLASDWQEPDLCGENVAFLQYTSGSTGNPKGVIVTHSNLMHNEQTIELAFGHTNKTVFVGWLPLFHDMGLIGNVLQPLYLGIPCVLMPPVAFLQKPFRWLQAISRYKGTTSGGPNFAYDLCIRKITPEQKACLDLSSWEVAFNGSEPIRAETLEQFAAAFESCGFRKEAFYPCYGMAETTLFIAGGLKTNLPVISAVDPIALEQNQVVASIAKQENVRKLVGCGQTWLEDKIAIVEPESLTRRSDGQVGEIWVASSSVAGGYWQKSEQTEQIFNAYLTDTKEGPYLRTGDLGFVQHGELFVTGRLKDVIIIRGRNYYPQDIELTVEKSHPALRTGCGAAFSVEDKGQERLVVVQEVERSFLRKPNANEVIGNIRQAVTQEHELEVYAVLLLKPGSIPKTSSGKLQRYACRAGFLAGTLDVVEDWSKNPQNKMKFLHLQVEVNSMLEQLQNCQQL